MTDATNDLQEPVRRAKRATRSAARTAKSTAAKVGADAKATADTVAGEAKSSGRRSARTVKAGAVRVSKDAKVVKGAAEDSAELAQDRLRASLEAIQRTSEEMSRWAGARAVEAKDQASQLVQERPLGVVASIFAVGALLGVVAGFALRD
jgi:ElaB/YqjD/DUF883 family membrane-anchored ribosome-binding protein